MSTPRQLPLTTDELANLARATVPRSLDATLGVLAAVVSMPSVVPSQLWLGALIGPGNLTTVEEVQQVAEQVMKLNQFVSHALVAGEPRAFFPETDDDAACRDFVNGYLDICSQANLDTEDDEKIGQGLAMLVGYAKVTDDEMKQAGAKDIAGIREEIRSGLPEIIGVLHATWLEKRAG